MMRFIVAISATLLLTGAAIAQNTASTSCALIDDARDSSFIEFERVETGRNGTTNERRVVLRLKNNLTCSVALRTAATEHFLEPLPAHPTPQQIVNRGRRSVTDGEFIPELEFYSAFRFSDRSLITERNNGGDLVETFTLPGGNSILFSVSLKNLRRHYSVVVPFEFVWETKRSSRVRHGGETAHLVWFSTDNIPALALRDLGR